MADGGHESRTRLHHANRENLLTQDGVEEGRFAGAGGADEGDMDLGGGSQRFSNFIQALDEGSRLGGKGWADSLIKPLAGTGS
jgi:hypothetical protein